MEKAKAARTGHAQDRSASAARECQGAHRANAYENLRLNWEDIADWNYQPQACKEPYRLILRQEHHQAERGTTRLFDEIRYFFI